MIRTGGTWDPNERNVYFIAGDVRLLQLGGECHTHLLCALNEINTDTDREAVVQFVRDGRKVFLDSGVFDIAMRHAEATGTSLAVALKTDPYDLHGFPRLFDQYVDLMREIGDDCWGYVEIDQGGRENKIKLRTKLEEMGLRPIPVYHPLSDGWEYFDFLAQNYDRICFGNVVHADRDDRKRLMATAWERREKYPHLWIHMLGLTPTELNVAYPVNSCDSSAWIASVRWSNSYRSKVCCQSFSAMSHEFLYRLDSEIDSDRGNEKAKRVCGYEARMLMENMQAMQTEYERALCLD